jgi:hypothetical protein
MLKRSLAAVAIIAATTLAASAREPVVIKAKVTAEKDQSRIASDPSQKPQKYVDFIAAELR